MGRKLNWIGGGLTIVYMAFMFWVVGDRIGELRGLKLNELGDFLAGAFGPVAFLWLVLGFLQQGEELRQGTEALRLQADELKNSVEQQSIMAGAAIEQIKSQQTALKIQQDEMERQYYPNFEFGGGSRSGYEGSVVETAVELINRGREVREVNAIFEPPIGGRASGSCVTMRMNGACRFEFRFPWPGESVEGTWIVDYIRLDGVRMREIFEYRIDSQNPFVVVERPLGAVPLRR